MGARQASLLQLRMPHSRWIPVPQFLSECHACLTVYRPDAIEKCKYFYGLARWKVCLRGKECCAHTQQNKFNESQNPEVFSNPEMDGVLCIAEGWSFGISQRQRGSRDNTINNELSNTKHCLQHHDLTLLMDRRQSYSLISSCFWEVGQVPSSLCTAAEFWWYRAKLLWRWAGQGQRAVTTKKTTFHEIRSIKVLSWGPQAVTTESFQELQVKPLSAQPLTKTLPSGKCSPQLRATKVAEESLLAVNTARSCFSPAARSQAASTSSSWQKHPRQPRPASPCSVFKTWCSHQLWNLELTYNFMLHLLVSSDVPTTAGHSFWHGESPFQPPWIHPGALGCSFSEARKATQGLQSFGREPRCNTK